MIASSKIIDLMECGSCDESFSTCVVDAAKRARNPAFGAQCLDVRGEKPSEASDAGSRFGVATGRCCNLLQYGGVLRMIRELPVLAQTGVAVDFSQFEAKFKALADEKRLQIMYELTQRGSVCVCDLTEAVEMPQSKLSYHLKILLDAGLIVRETKGTWSYYELNQTEVNNLLSPELCCIFRKD